MKKKATSGEAGTTGAAKPDDAGGESKPTFRVGDVLTTENAGQLTPILIYGVDDATSEFRLCNEKHEALNTTFTGARLSELGYGVVTHVDMDAIEIKPPRKKIVKTEKVEGSSGSVTMTATGGDSEPPQQEPTAPVGKPAGTAQAGTAPVPATTPPPATDRATNGKGEPELTPGQKAAATRASRAAESKSPVTAQPSSCKRRIVSLAATGKSLYALAEDGSLWRHGSTGTWESVAGLPD